MADNEFPEDDVCRGDGSVFACRNEPTVILIVEDRGGWVAKFCEDCFEAQYERWNRKARAAVRHRG